MCSLAAGPISAYVQKVGRRGTSLILRSTFPHLEKSSRKTVLAPYDVYKDFLPSIILLVVNIIVHDNAGSDITLRYRFICTPHSDDKGIILVSLQEKELCYCCRSDR